MQEAIESAINKFKAIIEASHKIVFFGGAGVSTESGIPDFRSKDGIYNQEYPEFPYPVESMVSRSFFDSHPDIFYDYIRKSSMHVLNAKPNAAHYKLAELEKIGRLAAIITQNIDGLHQAAGSKTVLELHGSADKGYCTKCGKIFGLQYILNDTEGIARCSCGGIIHPGGVMFEEPLDQNVLSESIRYIEEADTLIVGGTSLVVYPAAGLINYYRGKNLVLIDKDPAADSNKANLVIHDAVGNVFSKV